MRKSLITIIGSAAIAFGSVAMAPVHAAASPTAIPSLCGSIPAAKTVVASDVDKATKGLATATTTLTTRRTAMTSTISTFGASIANFLKAVDAGGNTAAAGDILRGHQVQFVDSVVAWSSARTAVSDLDRDLTFGQLRGSFLQSAETAGCPTT